MAAIFAWNPFSKQWEFKQEIKPGDGVTSGMITLASLHEICEPKSDFNCEWAYFAW